MCEVEERAGVASPGDSLTGCRVDPQGKGLWGAPRLLRSHGQGQVCKQDRFPRSEEEMVASSMETANSRGQARKKRSENAPRECAQGVGQNPKRN